MLRRLTPDWFLTGMLLAIVLAWALPAPGAKGGVLQPELLVKGGIALIFFLHGLLLSFGALKDGVARWPCHLIIQAATFLLFPLIGLVLLKANLFNGDLALGVFYLCALPSTVSSSVAMTAAARGNVPIAVFNATLSSLLGIALTPLWISLVMQGASVPLDVGSVVLDLMKLLLLPLLLGQLLRPWLGAFAKRNKRWVSIVDRVTILLLVYTAFCDSFVANVWSAHAPATLFGIGLLSAVLLALVLFVLIMLCRALKSPHDERAAIVFCGTKKSLATGVPMAQLMFAGHPGLSLILLPIIIYHALQLIVCAAIASRWARQHA